MTIKAMEDIRTELASASMARGQELLANILDGAHRHEGPCVPWGELCEEAGLLEMARAEYRHAWATTGERVALWRLVDLLESDGDVVPLIELLGEARERDPKDHEALLRSVALLRQVGRYGEAQQIIATAASQGVSRRFLASLGPSGDRLPSTARSSLVPDDADLLRFLDLFKGREDVHARQWHDPARGSGYAPVMQPLGPLLVRNHLLGNVTLGVYLLQRDATVRFFVVDLDVPVEIAEADPIASATILDAASNSWVRALEGLGFRPLIEDSGGKGRHVWVILERPTEAGLVRELGRRLLESIGPDPAGRVSVEFFPKQSRLTGKGLGHLIKLPLGIHRRSGRRSYFLDSAGKVVGEPWELLRGVARASSDQVAQAIDALPLPEHKDVGAQGREVDTLGDEPVFTVARPWTDEDFATDEDVGSILQGCALLRDVTDRARGGGPLSWDEQIVLRHSLGHLARGPQVVNHLLGRAGVHDLAHLLKSPLAGAPMSCSRLRKRLRAMDDDRCRCTFENESTYPHPLLHIARLGRSSPWESPGAEAPSERGDLSSPEAPRDPDTWAPAEDSPSAPGGFSR